MDPSLNLVGIGMITFSTMLSNIRQLLESVEEHIPAPNVTIIPCSILPILYLEQIQNTFHDKINSGM